jgi:addiction module RelE/StbE family toxin
MQIFFKKSFIKQYGKLKKSDQSKVDDALEIFEKNPLDPQLKNHALIGRLMGKRAISAGFDLRIVFASNIEYVTVTILAVGTHNQVY